MTWAVLAASWEEGGQQKPGPPEVGSDSPPALQARPWRK